MIICEGENLLEVTVLERDQHPQSLGDTKFAIRAEAEGFNGRSAAWVAAEQLTAFVGELRSLEADRRGSAELTGMSPGEFRLRISVIDHAGHAAVDGRITRQAHSQDLHFEQSLEFRFPFCPSQLPALLAGFAACI